MSKLEDIMKKEGWELGYSENYGFKYWSFRKNGFEINLSDISRINIKDELEAEQSCRTFKAWRKFA